MLKTFATLVLAVAVSVFVVLPLGAALFPAEARADETLLANLKPGFDGGTAASLATVPVGLGGKQVVIDCATHEVRYRTCKVPMNQDGGNADGGAAVGLACAADATSARVPADQAVPKSICVPASNNVITLFKGPHDGGVADCNLYLSQPKTTICP